MSKKARTQLPTCTRAAEKLRAFKNRCDDNHHSQRNLWRSNSLGSAAVAGNIFVVVALVALECALSAGARGQTGNVCVQTATCSFYSLSNMTCEPPLPKGATSCQSEGPFSGVETCEVVTNNCGAPPSWCPTCGKGTSNAGSPINLTNGNTYIQETDLKIPGLGGGLFLKRTWNSLWPAAESAFQNGMFGLQWRSNYEERVFAGSGEASGYTAYLRGDGGLWYFSSNGALGSPANQSAQITQNGTQSWTITFKNGVQRVFSYATGALTSIVDRNGNTTNLTYDSSGRLNTVTDPASQHLYFAYGSNTSPLVTSITSDTGVSLAYSYDSQGRLTQVTEPDQSTLSFQYNSQSLISTVLDSNGKTLESHTYDSQGRGLTSCRAGGVDAVTISYPQ
jgi:YD repeat-containing protein